MDLARIKSLIDLVAHSPVTELELSEGGSTLRISRHAGPVVARPGPAIPAPAMPQAGVSAAPPEAPSPTAARDDTVRAPSFGVFHRTPSPEAPPFVMEGSTVEAGQTLCLIEAMKVFTAVTAPRPGVIDAILAEAGDEVEAEQMLFRLRP